MTTYRIYADNRVVHQDDFEEQDRPSFDYYDDYETIIIPKVLEEYIREMLT